MSSPVAAHSLSGTSSLTTSQITSPSDTVSLSTNTQSTVTNRVTNVTVICQCRCYRDGDCINLFKCCGSSPSDAVTSCQSTSKYTTPAAPSHVVSNIVPAATLAGSRNPERLAPTASFTDAVSVTEQMFEASDGEKRRMGFDLRDMLNDCKYDGSQCSLR